MDINDRIKEQLDTNAVMLYIKGTPDFPQCGFSSQAVAALKKIGKPFSYVNIFEDPEIREGLKVYSNWPTFPQLYVKGELIGGCDIMMEMYENGEVSELLIEIYLKKQLYFQKYFCIYLQHHRKSLLSFLHRK